MSFIYTQADLQARINSGIQGKFDIVSSKQDLMNASVRDTLTKVDLISTIRRTNLAPNLFNGIFPYTCPADLASYNIIDIPAQAKRSDGEWQLTTPEEFDIKNGAVTGMIAIDDYNGQRILKLASAVDSDSLTVAELDSLTSGGGTWSAFGDAINLAADDADYVKGAGSIKWDISAVGGTTAGIVNTAVDSVDITDYLGGTSAFFIWVKINSATNLTNYILRFGNDSSNYYSKTVTAQADGTAFVAGWNLLKFDVSSLTETGSVTDSSIVYFAIYMTKTAGKVSETDYKFDWLVLKKGIVSYLKYYSSYGWQTSAGAYIQNSTTSTDLIVANEEEFNLHVLNGIVHAMHDIMFPDVEIQRAEQRLEKAIANYAQRNPSQRKILITDYYNF